MVLTNEQARHFYELWIPLLDYVNRRHRIDKSIYGMNLPEGLPIDSVRKIRDMLWEDRSLLDDYIRRNPNQLPEKDLGIIVGWKNAVAGTFVVLRHLKSGSIFIPLHRSDAAYIVSGIFSPWDEMLQGAPVPQVIDAVLIPFEGKIICDSIIVSRRVQLVGGMRASVNEHYRKLKTEGCVFKTIGR